MKKFLIFLMFFSLFSCKIPNQNINQEEKIAEITENHKENVKKCIQKIDKNFFEENKNKWSNATLQAFQHNNNCYYILIEKNFLPLYLVFSFDDTTGVKNPKNGAYYFFDSINIQDFGGHDYSSIKGNFINSLDNVFIENNLEIPKISYNLDKDLQNWFFISNSINETQFENILEKIWNFRDSTDYKEKKEFYKNENKKYIEELKAELKELKECGENCEELYQDKFSQYEKILQNNSENPHQKCADNSPLKSNNLPKIYWAFENENNKKCWYLGYIDRNFFLTNEDDFLVKHATGEHFNEIEWKKWNWEDFDGTYGNLLYNENYLDFIEKFQTDFWFSHGFVEALSFHEYLKNTTNFFHEKFKKYSIELPANPIKIQVGNPMLHTSADIDNIHQTYEILKKSQ